MYEVDGLWSKLILELVKFLINLLHTFALIQYDICMKGTNFTLSDGHVQSHLLGPHH
jgi:hypothetical protein